MYLGEKGRESMERKGRGRRRVDQDGREEGIWRGKGEWR